MTTQYELLKDRFQYFSKHRSKEIFFDNDLNSHIILNFKTAVEFLKMPEMSSNRKKQQFSNLSTCPYSSKVLDFYSNWLMYMDGDIHKEYRQLAVKALSFSSKNLDNIVINSFNKYIRPYITTKQNNIEFVSNVLHPFTIDILSTIFGIDRDIYNKIILSSKPIVSFITNGEIGSLNERKKVLTSLELTQNILDDCIKSCKSENSFIGYLLDNKISIEKIRPLLINILIDGYDPLISVINYYFYILAKKIHVPKDISNVGLFDELVRLEPSFQYCARVAKQDVYINNYLIKKGERVTMFISSANRDPSVFMDHKQIKIRMKKDKHISFGAGKHRCLGANIAQKVVTMLISSMKELETLGIKLIDENWINNVGFRAINKLYIKVE
ncbi:cytochrome P450 [Volucribacter psittacicida]|uniref:Cytochrome P450 n=1 Tax=Volucribacter psittacicida TaxID=203482 RepID=A0A4R1FL90_9PAST|nr:cytochrome P450 [Volucribacter psittacicida]TCJ94820.1 cytochrome P450 [Volucribacter psittacicida]